MLNTSNKILFSCLLVFTIACNCSVRISEYTQLSPYKQSKDIYTFGDATYDKKLKEGVPPTKLGVIPAHQIPQGFPQKFLETDGSYGGGHVYRTIAEAEQGLLKARRNGTLPSGEEWGIYQLSGAWNTDVYELHPHDYRLRCATTVLKRVK